MSFYVCLFSKQKKDSFYLKKIWSYKKMEKQRESFIFYRSFAEALDGLSDKDRLAILDAIIAKSLYFEEKPLKGIQKNLFALIAPQIEANNKRYLNGCQEKKKQNESKTEANNKQDKSKDEANNKQTISKTQANENDNVNDNIISPPYNPPPLKVVDRERKLSEFDLSLFTNKTIDTVDNITRNYPRKGFIQTNAQCAILNAIQREMDKGNNEEQACTIIDNGVTSYMKAVKNWQKKDKRFITDIVKFFKTGMYLEDPIIWQRENNNVGATDYEEYIPTN